MANTPEARMPEPRQQSGLQGALKARRDDFTRAGIILMLSEEEAEAMNLIELQKLSSAELRDMYNKLADRQVKRFADRVEAEKRTAQQLRDAGQWEGAMPDGKQKAAATKSGSNKTVSAPAKAGKGAKSAGKATPAPKAAGKPEKVKSAGAKAPRQPVAGRGAPRTNPSYRVIKTDAKMNSGSARTKVFLFVQEKGKGKNGIDRESIENHFVDDETVNVKSSLDYLVKVEILELVEA